MKICLDGEGLEVELSGIIENRGLIQANSGGGKSWALRRILEESYEGAQQIIFDLEGEFATLREQYEYLLVGGESAELPISIKAASLLPRRLLELGVSTILDLSELKKHERLLFVKRFLDALIQLPKKFWKPVLVVVDEAHQFAPQAGKCESLASVIDLMTRGRKRGYGGLLATQRLSKLHKDAAAEANNIFVGRTGLDVDMKRAGELLGMTGKDYQALRWLEPGSFYGFGPAFPPGIHEFRFGAVRTTHPKSGARHQPRVVKSPERIAKLAKELADLPAEAAAEERSSAELRKEVSQLKRQLTIAQGPVEKKVADARREGWKAGFAEGKLLAPAGDPAHRKALFRIRDVVLKALDEESGAIQGENPVGGASRRDSPPDGLLSGPQERILAALAELHAVGLGEVPRPVLAVFSRQSPRSSGYTNNLSSLRSAGLIDYGVGSTVRLTDSGVAAAPAVGAPASTAELQERWCSMVSRPQARILRVLIDSYPGDCSREDLAERAGQSSSSSGYTNNLSRLRSMGALDYSGPGRVVASKNLFLGGGGS